LHIAAVFASAVAVAAWHPASASAQARRLSGDASDSVPRALAEAVMDPLGTLRVFGGGRARLVVGSLPSGLAQRLWVPPGSVILGGVESSGINVAVIHSSLTEDSLRSGYRREQLTLGWTAPQAPQQTAIMGFVPATSVSTGDDAAGAMFCSGGTMLIIAVTKADFSTQEIRAVALNAGDARCRSSATAARPTPSPFRAQYQTLVNPPGSGNGFTSPGCQPWNSTGGGGSTRLHTTMTVDDVFAYYGKQLADSGWTATTNETVARTWTRRDSTGALVQMTLTARTQPSAPGCIEVGMEVRSRR